jgi:arylsulfatase A-like enzyme
MLWLLVACTKGQPSEGQDSPIGGDDSTTTHDSPTPTTPALEFEGERPKNLLVISVDTTRRDHVGFFDDFGNTPNLTAVFSSGVVLEDHRSCSNWTSPSTLCAQSGRFPLDEGYWYSQLSPPDRDTNVPWPEPEQETLASILTGAGFYTELLTTNSAFSTLMAGPAYGFTVEKLNLWQQASQSVPAALAEAHKLPKDVPWYFHVHFIDPHGPYMAPAQYLPDPKLKCPWDLDTQFGLYGLIWTEYETLDADDQALARQCVNNVYSAEIRYWDDRFADLWADLDKSGLLDDTLVVFWTDHGEQIGDHGEFEHGMSLYDEENASTLAFWSKNIVPLRWTGPTIHQDISPTILEALGVPAGKTTGYVVGEAPEDRIRVTFDYRKGERQPMFAAIQGDRKLMYWFDGTKELFDLSVDPGELNDLYDATDPQVKELWEALLPYVDMLQKDWKLEAVDPGP